MFEWLHRMIVLCCGLLPVVLTGCAVVGPDYRAPVITSPVGWNSPLDDGLSSSLTEEESLAHWWTAFGDPVLDELVEDAVKRNLDLRLAVARIGEARAALGISRSDLLPSIDGSLSLQSVRASRGAAAVDADLYRAGFDAGWEVDLFGGIRRTIEASSATLEAEHENLRDVLVSLLAEVALNYSDLRTFQSRIAFAEANRDAQAEALRIVRSRFKAGLVNRLDVEQAQANLENTRAQIPLLKRGIARSRYRLAVLLGEAPGALDAHLAKRQPIPEPPTAVAVGVPADSLRRRPDVRRAERELAAQTARVGVATAELYPKLRLSGSVGLEALSLGELIEGDAIVRSILPSFSWRVFSRSRIRREIEVQDALQEQALVRYEASVLAALEEVENTLVAYVQEQQRRDSLALAAESGEQAVALSLQLYKSGLRDFQDVLDAQRSLLGFQDSLATSDGEVVASVIRLYKALGGGWIPSSDHIPTTSDQIVPDTTEEWKSR